MFGLFGGGGDDSARQARDAEARRQNAVVDSMRNVHDVFRHNFDDNFFTQRRNAYLDYAKPQLNDQFADARKQLIFSLDRSGQLDSTARTTKEAELAKLYGTNSRAVSDAALGYEQSARNNVAGAESDLLSGIAQSGNIGASVNAANARASALSQPDVYQPLGQMFGTFTNALATQAALEKAAAMAPDQVQPYFKTGIFAPSSSVTKY
jgi:hypothetical protein